MYDDLLFPVSFYLMDDEEVKKHGRALASAFDARVHLLSLTLHDEGRRDVENHREAFEELASELASEGLEITTKLREDPVEYEEVPGIIAEEADEFDLVVMGHTRINRDRTDDPWTTADAVINSSQVPVFVVPLNAPRFRNL